MLEGAVAALLVDGPCEGGEVWFDCACELVSAVFGLDWLVVVEDLSEEVAAAFWETAPNSEKSSTRGPVLMDFDWSGFAPRGAVRFSTCHSVTERMRRCQAFNGRGN